MSAPTTQQSGYNYVVSTGGTEIGGGTNATLNLNASLSEATNKSTARWKKTACGTRSWSVDLDNMYLVSSTEICGSNMSVTVGGAAVKGLKQMDIALSAELMGSVNSTTGLDREIVPGNRTFTATISGDWYDFHLDSTSGTGGDEALEDIFDAWFASSTVSATIVMSTNQSFAATTFRVSNASLGFPHDGIIPYNVTLEATGTPGSITQTSADSGLAALFSAFLNAAGVQSATILLSDGTTDDAEWTGTAYPENINVSIPFDGTVSVSGTYQGSGALTQQDAA